MKWCFEQGWDVTEKGAASHCFRSGEKINVPPKERLRFYNEFLQRSLVGVRSLAIVDVKEPAMALYFDFKVSEHGTPHSIAASGQCC
jgi:hypothetical protein